MARWAHCDIHNLDHPVPDGCPFCREENGDLVPDINKENPSMRLRPLRRKKL